MLNKFKASNIFHGIETIHLKYKMKVRDYDLDRFATEINSIYQNYLEHMRRLFLEESGARLQTLADCY